MAYILGSLAGLILARYFVLYPIIYFIYNWFIEAAGFPQYVIPGFWIGMAGFAILTVISSLFKR